MGPSVTLANEMLVQKLFKKAPMKQAIYVYLHYNDVKATVYGSRLILFSIFSICVRLSTPILNYILFLIPFSEEEEEEEKSVLFWMNLRNGCINDDFTILLM